MGQKKECCRTYSRLLWAFLHQKGKSVASSWKEAVDAGTLDVADPAQGKPRGKILSEDMWDTVRWKVGEGSVGRGLEEKRRVLFKEGYPKEKRNFRELEGRRV